MVACEQEHPFDSDNDGAPTVRKARKLHVTSANHDHVPARLVVVVARARPAKRQQEKAKEQL
jgi:hypothetical protein